MSWHRLARGALGLDECASLLSVAEAAGWERIIEGAHQGPAGYAVEQGRDQWRAAVEHAGLAGAIWARVAHLLADLEPPPLGLNERLRFYAYDPGQGFPVHTDGAFARPGQRSRLTLLVYLNDGYEGGQTVFPDEGALVEPGAGTALLFPHARRHAGLPVRAGRKVVLRTDVLFEDPR